MADFPGAYESDVVALVDGEPDVDTLTLVVVARPEDVIMRRDVPLADAEGNTQAAEETLDLDDGIVASGRWTAGGPSPTPAASCSAATARGPASPSRRSDRAEIDSGDRTVDPADPRDQDRHRRRRARGWRPSTGQLLRAYGLTVEQARPTLLAAGPLAGAARQRDARRRSPSRPAPPAGG